MEAIVETPAQMWTIVIIGISTVFICLIALVLMVGFFRFLVTRASGSETRPSVVESPKPVSLAPATGRGVDAAIVAAIVAAISAASGIPASSIRLASIERTGFNTPVWGHIDRV